MPRAIKKRTSKKTGIKEEEVRGFALRGIEFIRDKKNIVVLIVAVFIITAFLVFGLMTYSASQKKKAYSFEKEAYSFYYNEDVPAHMTDEERWRRALEIFQKAIEIKPSPVAYFYVGNCYFNLGEYDNAIKTYNAFINRYKGEKEIFPLVYQKLAALYIKQGEEEKAFSSLNALAQIDKGIFRDTALILEARQYEGAGKHDEAIKRYDEIVKTFPSSPWFAEAQAKIERETGK